MPHPFVILTWRSVWQTPLAARRTRISSSPRSSKAIGSTATLSPAAFSIAPRSLTARGYAPFLPNGRLVYRPRPWHGWWGGWARLPSGGGGSVGPPSARNPSAQRHVHAEQRTMRDLFEGVIGDGMRGGSFVGTDPKLAALALLGMCTWVHRWYRPRGRLTETAIADDFAERAIRMLKV